MIRSLAVIEIPETAGEEIENLFSRLMKTRNEVEIARIRYNWAHSAYMDRIREIFPELEDWEFVSDGKTVTPLLPKSRYD